MDSFAEGISALSVTAAPLGNQRLVVESTGQSFVSQTRKLTDYVRRIAAPLTPAQRRVLDEFLRVQDGDAIANRAVEVSTKVLANPGGGAVTLGFFSWLQENLQTLKKIIRAIIHLLGEIFDFTPPTWINDLINILDEIFNFVLSLLGGALGLRMSQIADELSKREVSFLKEMTQLAAWHAASKSIYRPADEEA